MVPVRDLILSLLVESQDAPQNTELLSEELNFELKCKLARLNLIFHD